MQEHDLIWMMFENEPIETFEKLLNEYNAQLEWGYLLHMTYCEDSYESVGGDYGDEENPPINHERIKYLEELIVFLEGLGIEEVEP